MQFWVKTPEARISENSNSHQKVIRHSVRTNGDTCTALMLTTAARAATRAARAGLAERQTGVTLRCATSARAKGQRWVCWENDNRVLSGCIESQISLN